MNVWLSEVNNTVCSPIVGPLLLYGNARYLQVLVVSIGTATQVKESGCLKALNHMLGINNKMYSLFFSSFHSKLLEMHLLSFAKDFGAEHSNGQGTLKKLTVGMGKGSPTKLLARPCCCIIVEVCKARLIS
jgi:hypothetical protein